MEIITRKQAKEQNLKRYYTGKECKHGHLSERYTKWADCIECHTVCNYTIKNIKDSEKRQQQEIFIKIYGGRFISREEAVKQGLPTYFTGKKCVHGHISEYFVKGRVCVTCINTLPNSKLTARQIAVKQGKARYIGKDCKNKHGGERYVLGACVKCIKMIRYSRLKRRKLLQAFKDKPCIDCNKKFPYYVMDFDHVRGVKKFNLGMNESEKYSEKEVLKEMKKCELVCSNCHRNRTNKKSLLKYGKVTHTKNYKAKQKRRTIIQLHKNKPCLDCKKKYPYYTMEFDHVRGVKEFVIAMVKTKGYSKTAFSVSEKDLIKEINKCDVVCSNCHRTRTFKRMKHTMVNNP